MKKIMEKKMNPIMNAKGQTKCIQPAEEQFKMYLNLPIDIQVLNTAVFNVVTKCLNTTGISIEYSRMLCN